MTRRIAFVSLLVFVCFLAPFVVADGALAAEDEASAVVRLSQLFPALLLLPPYARTDAGIGGPWSQNLSSYCPMGTVGWVFYGLHCDGNGHIDQITLYA